MATNLFTGGDLPPSNPDEPADGIDRTFGWDFTVATNGTITGGRVYGPTNSAPTTCRIKLFAQGTETLLAAKTFPSTISTGTWNDLSFDTPVSVASGTTYTMCYYMNGGGHWAHTNSGLASPKSNGGITASGGKFKTGGASDDYPSSTTDALFFVDVNFESAVAVAVDFAAEVDTALAIGMNRGVAVAVASEVDTAFDISMAQGVHVDLAFERDTALPIGITGGILPPPFEGPADATFWANVLADTIVAGVPTLAFAAAINTWLDRDLTTSPVRSLNEYAGRSLPNWLDLEGVVNELAGTVGLAINEAMEELAT